jgi:hypothetical protein
LGGFGRADQAFRGNPVPVFGAARRRSIANAVQARLAIIKAGRESEPFALMNYLHGDQFLRDTS